MKNQCSLIQDLLPLYLEKEVSPETRQIIDAHIQDCTNCKNLVSDYTQSSAPIPIDELSDHLDTAGGFKKYIGKIKRLMLGTLITLLISILIVGTTAFLAGRGIRKTITYVGTQEDVFQYYGDKISGLSRAEKEGNYQNIDKQISLPDELGTATFDKIWYTKENIYVFYHIKPGEALGKLEDVQLSGTMYWDTLYEDEPILSAPFTGGMEIGEWVSHDGLYYKVLGFTNNRERFAPSSEAIVDNLTIDLELLYIPNSKLFNPKQEHADIGTIDFSALLDPAKEETYTMKLDKHITVQEGLSMDFQEFVMEPQRSLLRFKLSAPENIVLGDLAGILKTDKGEEKALWIPPSREDENIYLLELDALDVIPQDISIEIDEIQLITQEKLTFELDAGAFHDKITKDGSKQPINRELGSHAGSEYILESLYADDRGLDFTLQLKRHGSHISNNLNMLNSWASEEEYLRRIEVPDTNRRIPNLTRFINEKGEIGSMEDYGQTGGGPGSRMSMFIGKDFVEQSKTITVEVMNLVEIINGSWVNE